jgi:hypothetical protein
MASPLLRLLKQGWLMAGPDDSQADEFAHAADEVMAAIRELHERDGTDDVFGTPRGCGLQAP